jgi:hypothetical protein
MSRTDKLGITCGNCNTQGEVLGNAHTHQCPVCKFNYEAMRCGNCHEAYLTDKPAWSTSQCPKCGFVEKRRTAAELTFSDFGDALTSLPFSVSESSKVVRTKSTSAQQLRRAALDRLITRLRPRTVPIIVSVVFVALGMAYFFRWGPVGEHVPSLWLGPGDLRFTYFASSQVAHGQFGAIYNNNLDFVEFPGILVVLAPLGALSNVFHTTLLEVTKTHSFSVPFSLHYVIPFLNPQEFRHPGGNLYVSHPQWVVAVDPYVLLLSCMALFASDALAERLQVSRQRRAVVTVVEAVLLWNATVLYGHPEDAVAIALAVYALISAIDGRFVKAGWIFGAAVAFQPLVLLMAPVLFAMTGFRRGIGLGIRSVLPSAILLSVPLIANFSATFRELVNQPTFPNINHATPWTALATRLSGHGSSLTVAAGPVRLFAIPLAIGIGIWVARRRWLERPELLALACAVTLALRSYTESVLVAYYLVAALAIGVVVAARCSRWRFGIAISLAIATTVLAQQRLGWVPWWTIQVVGLTGVLVVAAQPQPVALAAETVESKRVRPSTAPRSRSSAAAKKSSTRGARSPATQGRSGLGADKKKRKAPTATKRSGRR